MVHVADEEVAGGGEALCELRIDQLVDHDPGSDHPPREPVAEQGRHDHERGQPRPHRHAGQAALPRRRRGLWSTVPGQAKLIEVSGQLRREGRSRLDSDLGRGLGNLGNDRICDRRPTGGFLERGHVALRNPAEVELVPGVGSSRVAHRKLRRFTRGQQLERRRQGRHLVLVDWNFQCDLRGKLREPAEVADNERTSQRERTDHAARGFAHRRRTQRDAGIARGHQRPEPVLADVVDPLDAFADQTTGVEPRGGRPDE